MTTFFILNNLHFTFEILGALAFFQVAWLTFDAYSVKRDFATFFSALGFCFLALWHVFHASGFNGDLLGFIGYGIYIIGLLLILWRVLNDVLSEQPILRAVIVLPVLANYLIFLHGAVGVIEGVITYLLYRQYVNERKRDVFPFLLGFLFLTLGSLSALFYGEQVLTPWWLLGHAFEIAAFFSFIAWVWQYLQIRVRESIELILISSALIISSVTTLAFSTILTDKIIQDTKKNLLTNVRVLGFSVDGLKTESLVKARLFAGDERLKRALLKNDFATMEERVLALFDKEKIGFMTIADENGTVILRAHALTSRNDDISKEPVFIKARAGESSVTIAYGLPEKFSIRAASPIMSGEKIIGVVLAGFQLDNAMVDNIKRITGLELSIYEGNNLSGTTILNYDGATRSAGIQLTENSIIKSVLTEGKDAVFSTKIFSRQYIGGYSPLRNADNKIVGMLASAKLQQDVLDTVTAINRLTLLAVAIIVLILIVPIYFITKRFI